MNIENARKLLYAADVFFHDEEEDEFDPDFRQVLNMNDTWAWASADGQKVEDEELPEVADLFFRYGRCGILFWVSQKNEGMRSEFKDINRFIDFVRHEEELRKAEPSSSMRAYKEISYSLGETKAGA